MLNTAWCTWSWNPNFPVSSLGLHHSVSGVFTLPFSQSENLENTPQFLSFHRSANPVSISPISNLADSMFKVYPESVISLPCSLVPLDTGQHPPLLDHCSGAEWSLALTLLHSRPLRNTAAGATGVAELSNTPLSTEKETQALARVHRSCTLWRPQTLKLRWDFRMGQTKTGDERKGPRQGWLYRLLLQGDAWFVYLLVHLLFMSVFDRQDNDCHCV